MREKIRFVLGVDEAGRGPLAGPVAVGVVLTPVGFDIKKAFPGVNDSKQLSEAKREEIFELLKAHPTVRYCVRYASHDVIDSKGISYAVRGAVARGVRSLAPSPAGVKVLLDGLLHAPDIYEQETIIGGDGSEAIIGLASIAAKVSRDRLMKRLAKTYPEYLFETHKGYGTALHYERIAKHGPCLIHRRTYLHLAEDVMKR
jgi:ribonuclease HII